MSQELTPQQRFDLEAAEQKREIAKQKNRAIIPGLTALADEVERRKENGSLSKELEGLSVSSLLGNLTRMISAIKEAAPAIVINPGKGGPTPDETYLRAHSAVAKTPAEREKSRRQFIEAEVVNEKREP